MENMQENFSESFTHNPVIISVVLSYHFLDHYGGIICFRLHAFMNTHSEQVGQMNGMGSFDTEENV